MNNLADLVRALVIDGGSAILAVDEARMLHAGRGREAAAAQASSAPTSVAVIPLIGPVTNRTSWYGPGLDRFEAALAQALANPDVGAIVLDVDSPGGTYAGTPEAANAVRLAAAAKPVTAVVDSLAASAAYWIASQAGQIVVTPSADVGSIGVLAVHHDFSAALEADGIKTTIVRSTPYKAEGNPFEPLSAEALGAWQADVDRAHGEFIRTVAEGRKVSQQRVREDFGQGRTVGAQRAVQLGMADRIGTLAEVIGGLRFRRRAAF